MRHHKDTEKLLDDPKSMDLKTLHETQDRLREELNKYATMQHRDGQIIYSSLLLLANTELMVRAMILYDRRE